MLAGARILTGGKVLPPRGWVCPRRTLSEHLLLYVRRGRGEIAAGGTTMPLQGGTLTLVPAGVPHLIGAAPGQTLDHWYLQFLLLDGDGAPISAETLRLPEVLCMPATSALEREFLRCVQAAPEQAPASKARMLASFFAVLDVLLASIEPGPEAAAPASRRGEVNARRTGQVMDAIALMMRHVGDDLSLEELSAHVDMSPSHFEKVFKRVIGSSPHAYYLGLKMERAKALLAESDCRLSDIAVQLGFASLHHFTRTFKQYEGEVPSRYAVRMRGRG